MHPGRFSYIQYDGKAVEEQAMFKSRFEELEKVLNMTFPDQQGSPFGRAKALALTNLEEAYMWVGKAIRDSQIGRSNRPQEELAQRGEG